MGANAFVNKVEALLVHASKPQKTGRKKLNRYGVPRLVSKNRQGTKGYQLRETAVLYKALWGKNKDITLNNTYS